MKVAMLGTGNVATHLSKALIDSGSPVLQVWSRNPENASKLALEIGADPIMSLGDLAEDVDLVILAISDDAIQEVVALLPRKKDRIVVHTSGSTHLSVLKDHPKSAVLYPLQTFSKELPVNFSRVPICIEASDLETQNQLLNLAKKLSPTVEVVDSSRRLLLHISAVFACNFTNHFYAIAQEMIEKSGLNFDLLKPLMFETLDKLTLALPKNAQTGPAKRNDQQTIQKHLDFLSGNPELQNIYQLISQHIVKMYLPSESSDK